MAARFTELIYINSINKINAYGSHSKQIQRFHNLFKTKVMGLNILFEINIYIFFMSYTKFDNWKTLNTIQNFVCKLIIKVYYAHHAAFVKQ